MQLRNQLVPCHADTEPILGLLRFKPSAVSWRCIGTSTAQRCKCSKPFVHPKLLFHGTLMLQKASSQHVLVRLQRLKFGFFAAEDFTTKVCLYSAAGASPLSTLPVSLFQAGDTRLLHIALRGYNFLHSCRFASLQKLHPDS